MNIPPFTYRAKATGSNLAPLPIQVLDENDQPRDMANSAVTVRVVDEQTGEVIVDGRAADLVQPLTLGRADFRFSADEAARITYPTTWLVQWTVIAPNGDVMVEPVEPIRLHVRPAL